MKFPRLLLVSAGLCALIITTACGGGPNSSLRVQQQTLPPTGANYTTCDSQQVPNWQDAAFQTNYQNAIQALITHYGNNPNIGYIRIGLGRGGEINLPQGWNQSSSGACYGGYTTSWGYTVGSDTSSTWNAYLKGMVNFEGSLGSPKELLVSITPVSGAGTQVDDFIAPIAVSNGMSFGNQGLEISDMTNFPNCGGDWCNLFSQYPNTPVRELQTLGQSCPSGPNNCPSGNTNTNSTGSLAASPETLLAFAVANNANDLELYYQDWLVAYDPSYSNPVDSNSVSFQSAYKSAIQTASAGASMQVLFPPTNTSDSDYPLVQQFVMNQSAVSGVVIDVDWSDFDIGNTSAGTHSNYDWSISDAAIALYAGSGKKVNLVLQNTTYGGNSCPGSGIGSNSQIGSNCAMPPWMWTVLSQ